jgi:isopenicillin-N epimerase
MDEREIGCMCTVQAPEALGTTRPDAMRLRDRLFFEHGIEVQVHARAGRLWVRVSAQAYNEFGDVEALGRAIRP